MSPQSGTGFNVGRAVDWNLAATLGGKLARPEPAATDYTRRQAIDQLSEAARAAEIPVREVTGLAEGGDVELVNGPQGGWHVDVTMRIYGLDPQELTMRIEGYDAATDESIGIPIERVLTERRVQPEDDHWLRVGDQLIFAIEACLFILAAALADAPQ